MPTSDFDDVRPADRFYLRRLYDLTYQGSLERLVEAIESYEFEDPTIKEGFFNLDVEIYRRLPNAAPIQPPLYDEECVDHANVNVGDGCPKCGWQPEFDAISILIGGLYGK